MDLRQLHAHEHSGHEEAEEDADKADEEQQEAVEFGNVWCVGAVQDYEAQASHREQETGSQTFHDVLPVHSGKQKVLTLVMDYLQRLDRQHLENVLKTYL